MKKQLLQFEIELDFALIGISCHLKDYRFVWFLNKLFRAISSKPNSFAYMAVTVVFHSSNTLWSFQQHTFLLTEVQQDI